MHCLVALILIATAYDASQQPATVEFKGLVFNEDNNVAALSYSNNA
jgi:hypothetical protein